jgi:integrase
LKWSDLDDSEQHGGVIRVRRAQWKGVVDTTKTGMVRSVPLVPELAVVLREHRAATAASGLSALDSDWVFPAKDGGLLPKVWLRWALISVLKKVGITKRVSTHGLRRTFDNPSRQVAGEIVTRSITGHVTTAMTEHYSHVGSQEKRRQPVASSAWSWGPTPRGRMGDQVGHQERASSMTPDQLNLTYRIDWCAGRGTRTPTSFDTRS